MASHENSDWRCCVGHYEDGKLADSCIRCSVCLQWIRPQNMEEECSGPPTKEQLDAPPVVLTYEAKGMPSNEQLRKAVKEYAERLTSEN